MVTCSWMRECTNKWWECESQARMRVRERQKEGEIDAWFPWSVLNPLVTWGLRQTRCFLEITNELSKLL